MTLPVCFLLCLWYICNESEVQLKLAEAAQPADETSKSRQQDVNAQWESCAPILALQDPWHHLFCHKQSPCSPDHQLCHEAAPGHAEALLQEAGHKNTVTLLTAATQTAGGQLDLK